MFHSASSTTEFSQGSTQKIPYFSSRAQTLPLFPRKPKRFFIYLYWKVFFTCGIWKQFCKNMETLEGKILRLMNNWTHRIAFSSMANTCCSGARRSVKNEFIAFEMLEWKQFAYSDDNIASNALKLKVSKQSFSCYLFPPTVHSFFFLLAHRSESIETTLIEWH